MKKLVCALLALMLVAPMAHAAAEGTAVENESGERFRMGYRMLKALYEEHGQFAASPASLALALSMAAEGASGETRAQLLSALGVDAPNAPALDGYESLKSANAAIVSDKIALLDGYKSALTEKYQAEILPMSEDIMDQVNAWANEHTDGMIPELLTSPPDPMLRLALLNALALDAEWQAPFDPESTRDGVFHTPDGEVTVPFMHVSRGMEYAEAQGAQAVKLDYKQDELRMILILPDEGELASVLDRIAESGLGWLGFAPVGEVRLSLPKLSLSSELPLNDLLRSLGVEQAFTDAADFSGMTGDRSLYLSSVLQKVRLDVDEQGTKAAAATGLFISAKGLFLDSIEMRFDRPFIALIQRDGDAEALFAAVVTDPSQP